MRGSQLYVVQLITKRIWKLQSFSQEINVAFLEIIHVYSAFVTLNQ